MGKDKGLVLRDLLIWIGEWRLMPALNKVHSRILRHQMVKHSIKFFAYLILTQRNPMISPGKDLHF